MTELGRVTSICEGFLFINIYCSSLRIASFIVGIDIGLLGVSIFVKLVTRALYSGSKFPKIYHFPFWSLMSSPKYLSSDAAVHTEVIN